MTVELVSGDTGQMFATGWIDDPEAVRKALPEIQAQQGSPVLFAQTPLATAADDDKQVRLWDAELSIYGKLKPSWNQKQVGSCVSFGWGRAINDLILFMVANGLIEHPGYDVATEPIYGGSRVEVGGGGIRGDGSIGAWAAKWVNLWGVLLRKVYGSHNLTEYSESLCRQYGSRGCPDDLEPEAKLYPVKTVALVTSADQAWAALGSNNPISICSNRGFTTTLRDGFCQPSGVWNHCMEARGRIRAKVGNSVVRAFAIQNSWGDYLGGDPYYTDADTGERVQLPEGCFLADYDVVNSMLRQQDSFAITDQQGFKKREAFRFIV